MDVGVPARPAVAVPRLRAITRPAWTLGLLVLVSSVVHTLLGWRRPSPGYFPDEYMYAELGRSLLEHGAPLVRGENAQFFPLLYPLLTAPAWLWHDVELAYRTIQALNSVAMSLTAIPVFLLARRLRLGDGLAVVTAVLALALPELLYASSTMAEAIAYPLALAAVAAAVAALERPVLRHQLAFVGFAGLATLARLQLAILLVCYAAALLAVGWRTGSLRHTLRDQWLAAAVTGTVLAAGTLVALRGIGIYGSPAAYGVDPVSTVQGVGATSLVLAYAAGWVVVPGAVIGLAIALGSRQHVGEVAFAAFTVTALALLLVQAGLVGDVGSVQERYVMYVLPLVLCAFGVWLRRGLPLLRVHAVLAAAAAVAAALVPLAGYAAGTDSTQSTVLATVRQLERLLGDVGLASLVVALGATCLSAVVVLVAWRSPRRAGVVAIASTLAVALGSTAAAAAFYEDKRAFARDAFLPADPSWIDGAADGPVTLLVLPRSSRHDLHTVLFWNREVRRLVLLGGSRPDAFASPAARVDGAGRLYAEGAPVGGLLLVDRHGTTVALRDATRVARGPTKELWRTPPEGAQLQLELSGRFYSGLLATEGKVRVWPESPGGRVAGYLEFDVSAPTNVPPVSFRVEPSSGTAVELEVPPGATRHIRVPVCSQGVWSAEHSSGTVAIVHGALVGLRSSEPRLVDDPSACR